MKTRAGVYRLTPDYIDKTGLAPRVVRDIIFTPDDLRLPDEGICRIFSNRRDAEIILAALKGEK
jgi:hypothetical protein